MHLLVNNTKKDKTKQILGEHLSKFFSEAIGRKIYTFQITFRQKYFLLRSVKQTHILIKHLQSRIVTNTQIKLT